MINKIACNFLPKVSFGNKKSSETVNKEGSKSENLKRDTDAAQTSETSLNIIFEKIKNKIPLTDEEKEIGKEFMDKLVKTPYFPVSDMLGTNLPKPIKPIK